jgi:hypothetical protein
MVLTFFKIVNMANPASPVLISTISMAPYGSDVTSVACNKKGIIAIAVIRFKWKNKCK